MTPEQQRIAIADVCGWWYDPLAVSHGIPKSMAWRNQESIGPTCVPDYLNDLNAMHEAEKVFWNECKGDSASLCGNYLAHLTRMKNGVPWLVFHATASQRAEAFLRTLNLWKD